MEIARPRLSSFNGGGTTVSCDLSVAGVAGQVYYASSVPLNGHGDGVGIEPFVCLGLIPAMRKNEDIVAPAPVSAKLTAALPKIQSIFRGWFPDLSAVGLLAPSYTSGPGAAGRGVGCFFSGGVDAFHAVLQHAEEIDTLIFVHGFDFPLAKTEFRQRVSREMRAAAASLGKRLIEVETDVRGWVQSYGFWSTHTHGAALASVAHLLAGQVRKVYVPSSGSNGMTVPWASHPTLDPLWSSDTLEIVHADDTITRLQKTIRIAGSDVALKHLRVCWASQGDSYNCGRCEKCLRTMLTLRLAGVLERCPTFDVPLDLSRVAGLHTLTTPGRRMFFHEILDAARLADDREVIRAVSKALSTPRRVRHWVRKKSAWLQRRVKARLGLERFVRTP